MRDLEKFKQILGPEADQYTLAQQEELRRQMYGMADLLLTIYLSSRAGCEGVDTRYPGATMKSERSKNKLLRG